MLSDPREPHSRLFSIRGQKAREARKLARAQRGQEAQEPDQAQRRPKKSQEAPTTSKPQPTKKLHGSNVLQGEALVALLIIRLAASTGCTSLELEGDALPVVHASNNLALFFSWSIANCIYVICLDLSSYQN